MLHDSCVVHFFMAEQEAVAKSPVA